MIHIEYGGHDLYVNDTIIVGPVREYWTSNSGDCFTFDICVGTVGVHALKQDFKSYSAAMVERTELIKAINRGLAK